MLNLFKKFKIGAKISLILLLVVLLAVASVSFFLPITKVKTP